MGACHHRSWQRLTFALLSDMPSTADPTSNIFPIEALCCPPPPVKPTQVLISIEKPSIASMPDINALISKLSDALNSKCPQELSGKPAASYPTSNTYMISFMLKSTTCSDVLRDALTAAVPELAADGKVPEGSYIVIRDANAQTKLACTGGLLFMFMDQPTSPDSVGVYNTVAWYSAW